jgi:hypothetical protein
VDEDNWYARALFDVEEVDAVHLKLTHHRFPLVDSPKHGAPVTRPKRQMA